jgi:hypothetical protein
MNRRSDALRAGDLSPPFNTTDNRRKFHFSGSAGGSRHINRVTAFALESGSK